MKELHHHLKYQSKEQVSASYSLSSKLKQANPQFPATDTKCTPSLQCGNGEFWQGEEGREEGGVKQAREKRGFLHNLFHLDKHHKFSRRGHLKEYTA